MGHDEIEFYKKLGRKMRLFRLSRDIKQYEVANELGMSQSLLCDREKGRKPISCYDRKLFVEAVKKIHSEK